MELTFTKGKITRELSGDYNIMLVVPKQEQSDMELLNELLNDDKLKSCKIDHKKKKRSLDSNSYAWVLITEIANVLRANKEEVYIEMLKRYGQREEKLLSVVSEAKDMIYRATENHCTEVGTSILNDKEFTHFAILIGSSKYDSKQMSIFIDGIVSEAKELSISTITPTEIEKLKSSWQFNQ